MSGSGLTAAILAGGKSSRMGRDKTLIEFLGKPLPAHVLERVAPLTDDVIVISNRAEVHAGLGLPVFADIVPGAGPLGGLYTALTHAGGARVLVVAADMPFLNTEFLRYLVERDPEAGVVVPRLARGPEALHAVYHKRCLAPVRAHLEAGARRVISFYDDDDVRVCYVGETEVARFDPDYRMFFNINTPDDLAAARGLGCKF